MGVQIVASQRRVRAGLLRHQVTIQSPPLTSDEYGDRIGAWAAFATAFVSVSPLRASEQILAAGSTEETHAVSHEVVMRYQSGVVPTMRISWGARIFDIQEVINPLERGEMLKLRCRENLTP